MSGNVHDLKNKWTRRAVAGLGGIFAVIMLTVSGVLNYRYGYTLGTSEVEKVCIGLAALSADGFMAVSPFFGFAAVKNKQRVKACCAFVLWFCMTGICAWSAVSQISFNRQESGASRAVVSMSFDDIRKDLADARAALAFIPTHRPEAVVRAEIDGLKNKPLWSQTGECDGEVSGKSAREFCQNYARLKSEIGSAQEANKIREKIALLSSKSEKAIETRGAQVMGEADAGATTVASLLGIPVRQAQSLGAMMFAMMLLLGTSMGLYVSWDTLRDPDPVTPGPRTIDITPTPVLPPPVPKLSVAEVLDQRPPPPPPEEPKLAPPVAARPVAPVTPAKLRKRPEPTDEARDMMTAIGFPVAPIRGQDLRQKDPQEHCAWRFLAWLAAYHLEGNYPADQVDALYAEFCQADHRKPWGMRVVKNEMASLRYYQSATIEGKVRWTIAPPSISKLFEMLQAQPRKNPVIGRAPKAEVEDEEPPPSSGGGRGPILKREAGSSVIPLPLRKEQAS